MFILALEVFTQRSERTYATYQISALIGVDWIVVNDIDAVAN